MKATGVTGLRAMAVVAVLAIGGGRSEAGYAILDIGTLGGTFATTTGINASNQVIGVSTTDPDDIFSQHGFVYDPVTSSWTDLGAHAQPSGINDSGVVVGTFRNVPGSPNPVPFRYSSGTTTPIVLAQPAFAFSADGVNNAGTVVGSATQSNFPNDPINVGYTVAANGTQTILSSPDGLDITAKGINDQGQIVGASQLPHDPNSLTSPVYHAFVLNPGDAQPTDLGALDNPAVSNSVAKAINNNGEIIGGSQSGQGSISHAFFYDGTMHEISAGSDYESDASGINGLGDVVGRTYFDGDNHIAHGFLYTGGNLYDLNLLIDPTLGLVITDATGINDSGFISANAIDYAGNSHALLLSPTLFPPLDFVPPDVFSFIPLDAPAPTVPEPSSLALLGIGVGAAGLAAWKRRRAKGLKGA